MPLRTFIFWIVDFELRIQRTGVRNPKSAICNPYLDVVFKVPTMSATRLCTGGGKRRRQCVEHFHRRPWIVEVHRAELNRRGAGDEEFHDVVDRGDAADADERRFHGLGRLVDGPQGDRLDRRAAEAAEDVAEHRLATTPVDRHAEAGVDQRNGVGPAGLGTSGNGGDAGDVRRQLGDDRCLGGARGSRPRAVRTGRFGAEIDAARDVRAGDIQFDRRDARAPASRAVMRTNSSCVRPAMLTMIGTPSAVRYGRWCAMNASMPSLSRPIELSMPAGGLDRSPRRVAGARLLRDRLGQDAAEAAEIDQAGHLAGVAERARRHEDRIRQPQAAKCRRISPLWTVFCGLPCRRLATPGRSKQTAQVRRKDRQEQQRTCRPRTAWRHLAVQYRNLC